MWSGVPLLEPQSTNFLGIQVNNLIIHRFTVLWWTFKTCVLTCLANFLALFKTLNVCIIFVPTTMLADDSAPQFQYLDHTVLAHQITDLNPQSIYTITICAVYGNSEGPEISLSQLTGTERKLWVCFNLSWFIAVFCASIQIKWDEAEIILLLYFFDTLTLWPPRFIHLLLLSLQLCVTESESVGLLSF